jgi:hypothetical protein
LLKVLSTRLARFSRFIFNKSVACGYCIILSKKDVSHVQA